MLLVFLSSIDLFENQFSPRIARIFTNYFDFGFAMLNLQFNPALIRVPSCNSWRTHYLTLGLVSG